MPNIGQLQFQTPPSQLGYQMPTLFLTGSGGQGQCPRSRGCPSSSSPISARHGPRHSEADPDYLEMITPNMLLTGRSGVDLPAREYDDEDTPSKRLSYKEDLESAWWRRWVVLCFDSLIPSKAWSQARRGVKAGDVVLISYSDKSKSGTFKFGIVESVEVDLDGLVRTCVVGYRIVRSDLPVEELRLYYKGLKFKRIRVPVQRLIILLPIEEQEEPDYLSKVKSVDEEETVRKLAVSELLSDQVEIVDNVEEGEKHVDDICEQTRIEDVRDDFC